ncbi:hypothetical protein RND81_13G175000 [Saponaria officinalis]|uniref:Leucine-rich repeat-containing N-terminal plant-type domain-containing protein n=1 Tax=Saponaria officinalis TaxID=3572 RepID=A0AAW1H1R6_SAPOF
MATQLRIVTKLMFCTLLVFYYSAELVQGSPKLSPLDLTVLVSIKNSLTDLPGSSFFSSWNFTDPNPCLTFAGVTCTLSPPGMLRVTTLELGTGLSGSLGLAGSLPETVSDLGELTQLILNPGMVTGPIPAKLGRLKKLRVLFLSHNRLTGPIPESITELTQLHTVDLSYNHLTGTIPTALLTELTQLKVLVLAGNNLSGELPSSSLSLIHLDLKYNNLVGPIPKTLPLTVRYVSLSHNLMWGPINGTTLKTSPNLYYLDLSYNLFSGTLPTTFLRPSLSTLLLSHNRFSGEVTVPAAGAVEYPGGATVDLSHNGFSGGLPEAAAGAENVFLNDNRFSGPIPEAYGEGIRKGVIKTLYLQHNFLDEFPKNVGPTLPENAEVCLAYNCMVPPLGLDTCPTSDGGLVSRPAAQCSVFRNG